MVRFRRQVEKRGDNPARLLVDVQQLLKERRDMRIELEAARVAIVDHEGVRLAVPASMTKLELACVLQGLAGALLADALEDAPAPAPAPVNGNGNGAAPVNRLAELEVAAPQQPQDATRRTKSDRRGLPRKKVVKRSRNGKREELECGHVVEPVPSNWKRHRSRACEQCAAELAVAT